MNNDEYQNEICSNITQIKEYLDNLKKIDDCIIIFAVKDTVGYWFEQTLQNKMQELGFKQNLVKKLLAGYIGIICNSEVIYESSIEAGQIQYYTGNIQETHLEVVSKPFFDGDLASVKIDGAEYAVNSRGMNIVIYDYKKEKIVDSVSFDTHVEQFTCKRNEQIKIGKEHYDIALVGCWWGANYGSCLNGYAIYKVLNSLGLSVLMVNKHNAVKDDWEITNTHNARFIEKFYPHDEVSTTMSYECLSQLNQYCDIFLTGSDQIWNYGINHFFNMAFMLNFVSDKKKKLSFGTSFGHGKDNTPKDVLPYSTSLLKRFQAISVREQSGADICSDVYGVRAKVVVEPVFCLTKEQYEELGSYSEINETEPYILTYILDPTPEKKNAILYYSEISGMKAINVLDGDPRVYEQNEKSLNLPNTMGKIGADDLMKLYQNASFVISDSFHGTCFSIIFNKPFLSITNFKRGSVRFDELLGKFNLTERLVSDPNNIPVDRKYLEAIDFSEVNEIIKNEREESIAWLRNAIETPVNKMKPIEITPKEISFVVERKECTGCGCCYNVCPTHAITMIENEEGFFVPKIDEQLCIECGLCGIKCTALNPSYKNEKTPKCFAVMAKDEVRLKSSSGGMFTIAAEYVIAQGGYVSGAVYRDDFSVEHIITNDIEQLGRMRGSKYIQSDCSKVYGEIKELLKNGITVLFTGMPCQVEGLYSYLGKEYDSLITMDLLCHGMTSNKVFDKYHRDVLENKPLKDLYFKAKEPWGWHAGVNAYFVDGTHYAKPLETDPYFIAYLSSISKNVACGVCKANKLPRQGDVTIGDFWGIGKYKAELNDGKGTSVVLVNNKRAEKFFETLKSSMLVCEEAPLSTAIQGNRIIEGPYALHKSRELFFKYFNDVPFDVLTQGCKNNKAYEQYNAYLTRKLPANEHEFYYLAKIVAENCKNREIVTWIRSPLFEKVLKEQFHLSVAFGVSMRKEAINNSTIRSYYDLKGKSNKYYLVSLDRAYSEEIYKQLEDFGYNEKSDFVFRIPRPIVLENFDCAKQSYFDVYGNTVEGYKGIIKKIVFKGGNNHITLGNNIRGINNLDFSLCANSFVSIGDGCNFRELTQVQCLEHNGSCTIDIGKKCRFGNSIFRVFEQGLNSSIIINESCTFENDLEIHANSGKKIVIGKDCMFSHDVNIWSGDGHTIFDVKTGRPTNFNIDGKSSERDCVVIGEHVWVAYGAFLIHGTNIGNGSIVGAHSVVKGIFPNNCSIAGNPANILKTDIAWSRQGTATNMDGCGKENINLTSYAKAPISGKNVLVIGGTRFMGIKLVEELIRLGNHVTIANRGHKRDDFGSRVERVIMDVSEAQSVAKALSGKYYDVVFDNLAYCSNYVKNVLDVVRCGRYVQLSSVEAYVPTKNDLQEADFNPYVLRHQWCEPQIGYQEGKRQAEATVYQKYPHISAVTVRIPYVAPTDRLLYYCRRVVLQKYMRIDDVSRGFTFIRDSEVGKFLPWIAAQDYEGPINLASTGFVTIKMLLEYIEKKTGKVALIAPDKGDESPFHVFNEKTFSMSMRIAERLGYNPSKLDDWLWGQLDGYIEAALKELSNRKENK